MQIHEITKSKLTEAGGFGSFMSGLTGGISDKFTQNKGTTQTAPVANKVNQVWANYAQQLKAANPDPARYATLYQQTLTAFVQKNLLGGQNINSAVNKQEITQLIGQIAAAKDNPQQVTELMSKLVQQSALSQQDVTAGSQMLAKVISLNPDILEYRGVTYAVNDNGAWANQRTGKVLDQTMQAFLDNEVNKAGGSAPTPSNPPADEAPPVGRNDRRASRTRPGR